MAYHINTSRHNATPTQKNASVCSVPKYDFVGKIHTTSTGDLFGVLLLQQETLDEIFEQSGPLAVSNEFQFHYTSLVGKLQNQGQELYISIPLVCYNYKQTVSGAHIGFNLEDTETMSDDTLEIAQMKAAEFLSTDTRTQIESIFGELDWHVATLQTMHRHPGGSSQGFSSTDLMTDPDRAGIVFPLNESIEKSISFSSIMYVQNGSCRLAHTEVRTALGSASEKSGILYSKGRSITIVAGYDSTPTELDAMFGIPGCTSADTVYFDDMPTTTDIPQQLTSIMRESSFRPEIFIDENHLSTETTYYGKQRKPLIKQSEFTKSTDSFQNTNQLSLFSRGLEDDIVFDQDELYEDYIDPLDQDSSGMYTQNPFELDHMDREILTDALRDELADIIYCGTKSHVFTEREIALKPEHEIWRLSRINKILKPL